jgi:hypothetical protein
MTKAAETGNPHVSFLNYQESEFKHAYVASYMAAYPSYFREHGALAAVTMAEEAWKILQKAMLEETESHRVP